MNLQIQRNTEQAVGGKTAGALAPATPDAASCPDAQTVQNFESMMCRGNSEEHEHAMSQNDNSFAKEARTPADGASPTSSDAGKSTLKGAGQEHRGQDSEEEVKPGILGNMTNPLEALLAQSLSASDVEAAAPAHLESPLATELVERILVNAPERDSQEIRLFLSQDILAGTEIRLQRGTDGCLSVQINTDNASSFQTIVAAQYALRESLDGKEQNSVRLEINDTRENDAQQGDQNRRSQGYQAYEALKGV